MTARAAFVWLATVSLIGMACTEAADPPSAAAGMAGQMSPIAGATAGVTAGAAMGNTGGAPMMAGNGGVGSNAGFMPTGGSGGAAGVDTSSGGQSGGAGGMGATGGMGDTGGASPMMDAGGTPQGAPTPSAGCSAGSGRPAGGVVTVAQSYYLLFPESYDGTQALPVLMAFHGCASVNRGTNKDDTEWARLTNASAFASDYVRAVPLSADSGGCWSYGNDIARVKQMYDTLLADHCVDTSRVFATGHSSGAQFVVQILLQSHTADAQHLSFKGVAPVAASDYGAMTGPIPVMYIQGMMDAERGNGDGHETVERFRAANACGSSSVAYAQVAGCQSGTTSVNPGCVVYDDCDAPTIWCSHNDPQYGTTMHGVPCFGVTAMHDFFESLM
jgi:poly(3-hydroxybutyrate) depolymerase